MHLYVTIITVFAELFVCVMSLGAVLLLALSYNERRTTTLLAYGGAFIAQTFSVVSFFLGHIVAANGQHDAALNVFRAALAFMGTSGLLFCVAAAWHLPRIRRAVVLVLAGGLGLNAVVTAATGTMALAQTSGLSFISLDWGTISAIMAPFLLYSLTTVWRSVRNLRASAKNGRPDPMAGVQRLFLAAGISGVAFVLVTALSTLLVFPSVVLVFTLLFISLGATAFAAAASDVPDEDVQRDPANLFRRSLLLKVGGWNALVVWSAVAIAVMVFFPPYAKRDLEQRQGAVKRDVQHFVESYRTRSLALLSDASSVAAMPATSDLIASPTSETSGRYRPGEFIAARRTGINLIRVVDKDGYIIYSSYAFSEVGTVHPPSRLLDRALSGVRGTAWEKSQTFGTWAIRASVPIFNREGAVVGAVSTLELDRTFVADDAEALSQMGSGYGLVAPDGDIAFATGEALDSAARSEIRTVISAVDGVQGFRHGDKMIFASLADAAGDDVGGHFYAYIADSDNDARAFLAISRAVGFAYLGMLLMVGLLYSAMTSILRPLREMRSAATKLGTDLTISKVNYDSPDEIGRLAEALNRTVDVVNQRSAALMTAMHERQDFVDHAARELRTPLTVFRWTLEAMRFGESGTFSKEQLDQLEKLHQTNARLEKMVENLQDVSMVEREQVHLNRHEIAIEDAIDDVAGEVAVTARVKNINLKWNKPARPMTHVYADPAYVQKILHNIVENAVKYTQPHGVVAIEVREADFSAPDGIPGSYVEIRVEDSGIGIPTDERPRIFSRFFRAHNVAEFEIEGAGLGLYLAKRFVELQGGDIRLTSTEGVGTTVTFTLPIVQS